MPRIRVHPEDFTNSTRQIHSIPTTPMQALMETAPGDEPVESMLEKIPRLEALRDALEGDPESGRRGVLDGRALWIVEAYFWRGKALSQIAKELSLSKTHVHRELHRAIGVLRDHLMGVPDPCTSDSSTSQDQCGDTRTTTSPPSTRHATT